MLEAVHQNRTTYREEESTTATHLILPKSPGQKERQGTSLLQREDQKREEYKKETLKKSTPSAPRRLTSLQPGMSTDMSMSEERGKGKKVARIDKNTEMPAAETQKLNPLLTRKETARGKTIFSIRQERARETIANGKARGNRSIVGGASRGLSGEGRQLL